MLGNFIQANKNGEFPEIKKKGIALFYVPEYRNDKNNSDQEFINDFRSQLYKLHQGFNWNHNLYDLGTNIPGKEIADTFHAISTVCQELIKKDIIPVVIGGSQDLTKARSEEHTSELQSRPHLVCRFLLENKNLLFYSYRRSRIRLQHYTRPYARSSNRLVTTVRRHTNGRSRLSAPYAAGLAVVKSSHSVF